MVETSINSAVCRGAAPAPQDPLVQFAVDFAFSVNGARKKTDNFLPDGVYNLDPKLNSIRHSAPS